MKFSPTSIEGILISSPERHEDERGYFEELYREDAFKAAGIEKSFVQQNHSLSRRKNTVRGLNFQTAPLMGKLMRVARGAAFLVAVDLRKGSPTLGKWTGIEASAENGLALYAPGWAARGFQTLTDDCEVEYLCDALHVEGADAEIRYNDPAIAITWPLAGTPVLSERNASAGSLKDWLLRPESDAF